MQCPLMFSQSGCREQLKVNAMRNDPRVFTHLLKTLRQVIRGRDDSIRARNQASFHSLHCFRIETRPE